MTARDDNAARPTALGRGSTPSWATATNREPTGPIGLQAPAKPTIRTAPKPRTKRPRATAPRSRLFHARRIEERARPKAASPSSAGVIAGGAAGAVAIAAFALLGVKAVLSMQRRNRLF